MMAGTKKKKTPEEFSGLENCGTVHVTMCAHKLTLFALNPEWMAIILLTALYGLCIVNVHW